MFDIKHRSKYLPFNIVHSCFHVYFILSPDDLAETPYSFHNHCFLLVSPANLLSAPIKYFRNGRSPDHRFWGYYHHKTYIFSGIKGCTYSLVDRYSVDVADVFLQSSICKYKNANQAKSL